MEQALADLLAKQDISEVIYRVARGTDRGNIELYASGFHEDGTDFHGIANGPVKNILAVLARSQLLYTQHAVSNIMVDLHGDAATVESCFTSAHQRRDEQGQLWDETIRGRYLDRFERRADRQWKIARRIVLWDWSRVEPSAGSWFDIASRRPGAEDRFIFGRRDKSDLVYTHALPAGFEEH